MPTCPTAGVALNPMSAPKPRSATLPLSDLLLISFNSPRFWICCIHTLNPRHSHLPFHTTLVSTTSGIQHVFVFNTYGIFPQCSLFFRCNPLSAIRHVCLEIPWQACLDLTIGMQALIHPDSFCEDVADASSDDRSGSEDESAVPSHWGQVQYASKMPSISSPCEIYLSFDLSIYLLFIYPCPHQHEHLSRTWILLKRKRTRERVV
jgi:hypothetical protein